MDSGRASLSSGTATLGGHARALRGRLRVTAGVVRDRAVVDGSLVELTTGLWRQRERVVSAWFLSAPARTTAGDLRLLSEPSTSAPDGPILLAAGVEVPVVVSLGLSLPPSCVPEQAVSATAVVRPRQRSNVEAIECY